MVGTEEKVEIGMYSQDVTIKYEFDLIHYLLELKSSTISMRLCLSLSKI